MAGAFGDRPTEVGLGTLPARLEMDLVESRVHERLFGTAIRIVRVGRFELLGSAGAGGMGVVFAAFDPELGRKVAIKLVARGSASSAAASQDRLVTEAQTMARLSHPNIVTVHAVGTYEGSTYVAMEYIDGETLEQWLTSPAAPGWSEILAAFVQAGRGLAAAHDAGIVHRDFKPSNAMIDRTGHVRVLDFGLAAEDRSAKSDDRRDDDGRSTSSLGGTPLFMAPELRTGTPASAGTDQYAFCVSLSRALSPTEVPAWLRRVLLRGLSPRPAERFPSMSALLAALTHEQQRARRSRQLAGATVVLAVSVAATFAFGTHAQPDAPDCHGFDRVAARAWSTDHRSELDDALSSLEPDLAQELFHGLETHAEELTAARGSACAVADVEVAGGRLQCLDRLERELATTVAMLERAGPTTVGGASMAVAELEAPSRCGATDSIDGNEDPEAAELLASAKVSMRAGLVGDAYATLQLACARLAERPDTVQWARCQVELGDALVTLGRNEEASIVLEQAHLAATVLDRPTIGVRAAELAARSALSSGRTAEAERWLGSLRAAAERLDDPAARVALAVVEADVLASQQRYAEALAILDAIDRSGLLARTTTSRQLGTRLRVARHRGRSGDAAGAERELDAAAELARALPESHVLVGGAHGVRAQHLRQLGRHEDALAEYRIMLDLAARYRLPDDPNAASARGAIAECLMRLGRFDEALVVADDNVRRAQSDDASTVRLPQSLLTRGQIHIMKEDFAAAQRDGAAALTLAQALSGGDEIAAGSWLLLANALISLGRPDEARTHAEHAVAEFGRMLGPEHPETLGASLALAQVESSLGNHDRASELNLRARDGLVAALGPDHPQVALASYNAGLDLESAGRHEAALIEMERSTAIWRAAFGDDYYETRYAEDAASRLRLAIARRR